MPTPAINPTPDVQPIDLTKLTMNFNRRNAIPYTSKPSGKHSVAKTNTLGPSARRTSAVHHNFSDRVHQFDDVDVLQEDTLLGNRDGCLIRVLLSRSKLCFVSHPKKEMAESCFFSGK
ncbi:hypothetical protein TNIN_199321 [Trichonephila inaurata madagascariensis]|uniref:Uncharacterized protein n=1 Tax=Trichonephila inaurata madagascariensis TaxID=2747483 RepID=A0A8X6X248_9ARAC|nr:hypothetical protein TNIN_199321 [Trichonephila inaurata madagascariensis]